MVHMHKWTGAIMPRWEFEISQSQHDLENASMWWTDDHDVISDDGTIIVRKVTSGSNLDIGHDLWTD